MSIDNQIAKLQDVLLVRFFLPSSTEACPDYTMSEMVDWIAFRGTGGNDRGMSRDWNLGHILGASISIGHKYGLKNGDIRFVEPKGN